MVVPRFSVCDDGALLTAYESINTTQADKSINQIQIGDTEHFHAIPYYETYSISSDPNHWYLVSIKEILQDIEHLKITLREINRRLQENYEIDISDLI